jgi:rhodanese-related sulfurtransferase
MHSPDDLFDQFARITSALAAPSRLKLIDRICQGEQTVEQLADASGLTLSNASRHLRVLAECRLVTPRREPPYVYYRIADDAVVRFWFALRDLARGQIAEIDRVVAELLAGTDLLVAIGRDELLRKMTTGEVLLLDVRPEPEYRAGHLPGAVSVPLEELEGRLSEMPSGRQIVAYCRGPFCILAAEAVRELRARGLDAVRFEDGVPEWKAAGLPVQRAQGGLENASV